MATSGAPNVTRTSRWSRALVAVCLVVLLAAAVRVAVHDPTSEPVSGDQASFVYQALSLRGGDLAYDADDQARWLDLGWAEQPHGLFVQARDDGWAFAKPLGYSVLLAPAMALADAHGIALVGAALLLAYAACWYGIGRLRWDRPTALAVATAATVASHAWLFAFPAHADLFVAVLVGVTVLSACRAVSAGATSPAHPDGADAPTWSTPRSAPGGTDVAPPSSTPGSAPASGPSASAVSRTSNSGGGGPSAAMWLTVAAVGSALLVTEKLPALVALAPLLVLAVMRASWRARTVAAVVGAVVLGAFLTPYLFYSDGQSWSAYGGDRYYAIATTPWSGGTDADLTPWQTRDSLSPGFVLDQATDPSDDLPSATLTYAIGRHTGVLTFQPIAALLLVAAAVATVGTLRRRATTRERTGVGIAAAVGLAAYVALYLVVFTDNYFGGGQSIGNRYFLQVSPLVAVVAVASPLTARAARWCAAGAAAWALIVLHPLLRAPEEAFFHLERTSSVQDLLPFDGSQKHSWRFSCEPAECVPPPLEAFDS